MAGIGKTTTTTTPPAEPRRDYPERPLVGVGAVIVEDGRALAVQRAREPLRGEWSVPGGLVEAGETLRQAAEREAREETGLLVEAGELLDVFDSIVRDAEGRIQYHFVLVDFLCRLRGGRLQAQSDVSEARWVTREELAGLGMREATAAVIRKGLEKTAESLNRQTPY